MDYYCFKIHAQKIFTNNIKLIYIKNKKEKYV